MKKNILDIHGKVVETISLNTDIWSAPIHKQAIYDTVIAHQAKLRQGTHKTKTRSEVSGGGKKPWKQKGTGRARQGSIRSPQWRGGGVVFGPTNEVNYIKKVNKKVKKLALRSALSSKSKDELVILDKINFNEPKTKQMIEVLSKLNLQFKKVLLVTDVINENVFKSLNNISKIKNISQTSLNVYDILNSDKLVITKDVIKYIEEVYS